MKKQSSAGFTIIELLIATVVFSIVLLTLSAAIIQIGRLYYKGITSARTQEVARSVMNDIAQSIQFDTGQVTGTEPAALNNTSDPSSQATCINTRHFSYKLGQQVTATTHALLVNEIAAGCASVQAQNLSGATPVGTELLGDKMRLSNLVVKQQSAGSSSYIVTVRVIYGDSDLLCSPSTSGAAASCSTTTAMTPAQVLGKTDLACKNIRSGSQFCAVSELSTIVERRL